MRHALRILAIGKYPEIEIDEDRFLLLGKSRAALSEALAIEQKYEIIVSNYLAFERALVEGASESMVRREIEYNDFFKVQLRLDICLVNLLTSGRLYIEQLHRHVRKILPDEDAKTKIGSFFSEQYDSELDYRFMEALRNFVQHRGLPVHQAGASHSRRGEGKDRKFSTNMDVWSIKSTFEEDKDFKKTVLDELPDKIDLKISVRTYVECLSRVQSQTRMLIEKSLTQSREHVETAISEYRQIYKDSFVGLHALKFNGEIIEDKIGLLLEWDDIRRTLVRRNSELVNLRYRYVTSATKGI